MTNNTVHQHQNTQYKDGSDSHSHIVPSTAQTNGSSGLSTRDTIPTSLSRFRSMPSVKPLDDQLIHIPILDTSYGESSLQSPRILNQMSMTDLTNDVNDETVHLKTPRPELLRNCLSFQNSIHNYGAINAMASSDIMDELIDNAPPKTNYYDDFTTIDWLDNSIKQSERLSHITRLSQRSFRNKIKKNFDSAQSWILIVIVAFCCACLAYTVDVVENVLIDLKRGYCKTGWIKSESACCSSFNEIGLTKPMSLRINDSETLCPDFQSWSTFIERDDSLSLLFIIYLALTLLLALLAVRITLLTKTTNPLLQLTSGDGKRNYNHRTWYTAYGSGVPEVKTILSGFIIRKFLGTWTLICKSTSLILAIASGMALGKEGPYVHLSACVGNICCRIFQKFNRNDLEKRPILSAATSAGVALAFGSPLGAVLFSIEEVSYYLPINQLFHIFICAMSSILFLKFMNPYGTGKTVFFEVEYTSDWEPIELVFFVIIGVSGGCFGALFCNFTQWWNANFRNKTFIKTSPVIEVLMIAALTASTTFYNKLTKIPTTELLYELASPCTIKNKCPILIEKQLSDAGGITMINLSEIIPELQVILVALVIKIVLTGVTFGLKLPAGIYVPSMVIGALFGRLFAMCLQYSVLEYPQFEAFFSTSMHSSSTPDENITCVDFGIYAMIGAGAFMAGVTRMNVTLAAILFELTSSYTYVLPISIAIAISNWVANMLEPYSLYELLIAKNDFPFLDNRTTPVFLDKSIRLGDLIPSTFNYTIDVTNSVYCPVSVLKSKLLLLQQNSLLDGCLSIVKNNGDTVIGLLPAPILEYHIDKLEKFATELGVTDEILIKVANDVSDMDELDSTDLQSMFSYRSRDGIMVELMIKLTDFTKVIDYNPIYLDHDSKLIVVHSLFSKLGIREICVLDGDGKFCGTLHKKVFIDYCKRPKSD